MLYDNTKKRKRWDILPANLIVLLIVLFFIFVISATYASASIDNEKTNIINYEMYRDKDTGSYDVKYNYADSKNVIFQDLNEDISKRQPNAKYYDGKVKIYSGDVMYQDKDSKQWFTVKHATTTQSIFNLEYQDYNFLNPVQELTYWQEILGRPVYAVSTTTYTSAGDGGLNYGNANWDTCHDNLVATYNAGGDTAYNLTYCHWTGATYSISRGYLPFMTHALKDIGDIVIDSASLYIYIQALTDNENDSDSYIAVCQPTMGDPTSLALGDYDGWTIDNCTKGSSDYDITGLTASQYEEIILNSTGIGWVSTSSWTYLGMRGGQDIEDTACTAQNKVNIYYSENGSNVPYLEITYTLATTSEETASSTADFTETDLYVTTDLTTIEATTYVYTDSTSSPSQIRRTVYHVPQFAVALILIILLQIFEIFRIEFLIRWRKTKK